MAAPPVLITPELLQAAWQHRRRPDWPATYADTMAHPMLRRLVRAQAIGLALAQRRRDAAALQPRPAPRQPALPPLPLFDPKRAAAGDTHDDDHDH